MASSAGSLVNKLGKYLNSNIDGAFKMEFRPMECDVYVRMYYQVPNDLESFDEMHFIINVTSYANKLRINITEDTEYEKTIGQIIVPEYELEDFNSIRKKVLTKLRKAIDKEFADFDFVV